VVQRYIDRPYLIDGRKGHCRIYCLVTATDPLRAYVYSEGIVRIAPEPYDPSPDRIGGTSMHVTNTALHVGHPGLVIDQDPAQEDSGAIRSLSALLRRMTADGLDGGKVFSEIKALVDRLNGEMFISSYRMAQTPMIDDTTPAELIAALRADADALRRREAEIEFANRGKFVPLDL
jgi:hypothetical protein